jgi:hypothetical protein
MSGPERAAGGSASGTGKQSQSRSAPAIPLLEQMK